MIASILPLAVALGTGVADASPVDTAQAPTTADWLSPAHQVQWQGPFPADLLAADRWTRVATVDSPDSPPAVDQEAIQAFCAYVPVDPRTCIATTIDAAVGAAIGAGLAAGVSAPVAIAVGLVGAGAGFIAGIPFLPTGLVVGPLLGAAVGVAVVAGPAALLGAAFGAAVGVIVGITTPLPQEDVRTEGSGAPTT
ncbi:hypothetical protein [Nocardia sp. NPDC057440]|uniref:hypothetical protein n=1 Tax=Nocardia sp. NPDC057440 TaxID=3346134 RepID=UPI00366BA119